jgi:hypothetical protein
MSVSSRLQHSGIDSATIVADQNPQLARSVFQFHLNATRPGVTERIHQCFPADTVNLIADAWLQWQGLALHNDPKPSFSLDTDLQWNS